MGDEGQALNESAQLGDSASSSDQLKNQQTDSVLNRRSRWVSSLAALKYCQDVSNDEDIKVRDSDRATAVALFVFCCLALACLVVPELQAQRLIFVIGADLLVGLALITYLANRFGIVTTFQPRQARLTWQLMLGSSLIGIFLTINLALVLAFVFQDGHLLP